MNHPSLRALALACLSLACLSTALHAAFHQQLVAPAPARAAAIPAASPSTPVPPPAPVPPPGMVFIPAGRTAVGTEAAQVETLGQRDPMRMAQVLAETPRHTVAVDAFFIDATEVTNLQWKTFLDATGRKPSSALQRAWRGGTIPGAPAGAPAGAVPGAIPAGAERLPVASVSFDEIRDYLRWSGRRLPTEAEWTRAARGDDARAWPWGDDWDAARCRSVSSLLDTSGPPSAIAVGSYPDGASPYGVLDLAGNVFEWVDAPFTAFDGFRSVGWGGGKGAVPLDPGFARDAMVIKGGGWSDLRGLTRIDARLGLLPNESDKALGFRTARAVADGLEPLRHAVRRLRPPGLTGPGQLDEQDIFGRQVTVRDETRGIQTAERCLAFAHGAERAPSLTKLRHDGRDAPLALGVLVTTEPILLERMGRAQPDGRPVVLPAGEYALAFKPAGESRAHRELRLAASRVPSRGRGAGGGATGAAGRSTTAAIAGGAAGHGEGGVASPGADAASIDACRDDIEFDQDADVILFQNLHHATVAWDEALAPVEGDLAPLAATSGEGGATWRIAFSVPQFSARKGLRFTLALTLAGNGFD